MATLLLCLAGPMQSWGTRSRFDDRDTERFPSKSGVLGLCCAALGWQRDAAVFGRWTMADLAALTMAAREDLPGHLARDFQTAQEVAIADGKSRPRTVISDRHYLADAAFLVGLAGDRGLLAAVSEALARPVWPLFLGRRGYVPSRPVGLPDGLLDQPLAEAVRAYPWLPDTWSGGARRTRPDSLWLEAETDGGLPRLDVPLGAFGQRRFGPRRVAHEQVPTPERKEDHAPCAST